MNYSKRPLKKHQKIKDTTEVLNKKIDSELEAIIKIIFSWIVNDLDLEVEEIKDT